MKKRVLVIAFKDFDKNLRGIKQINLLYPEYDNDYAGYKPFGNDININYIEITPKFRSLNIFEKAIAFGLLLFRLHKMAFLYLYDTRKLGEAIEKNNYDLIISHDLKPLHIIYSAKINISATKVILDAHEYFRGVGKGLLSGFLLRPYEMYFYRKYLHKVNHIDTVNESIANLYKSEFPSIPISFTLNVPPYYNNHPKPVNESSIRMIHHGYAKPDREIECMIEMMKYTDERFKLDLMLVSLSLEDNYMKKLHKLASTVKNVRIIPPVPQARVLDTINTYDIGVFILPNNTESLRFALPNKLFDFVQARLMVLIGPSVEMAKTVKKYNLGLVTASFNPKDVANELNKVNAYNIFQFKKNADVASKELCAEKQLQSFKDVITNLL